MTTAAIRGLRTALAGADRTGMVSSGFASKTKSQNILQISVLALLALAGSLHAAQAQDAVPADQTPPPVVQPKAPDAAADDAKLPDVIIETPQKPEANPAAARPQPKAVVDADYEPAPKAKPAKLKKISKKSAPKPKPTAPAESAEQAGAPDSDAVAETAAASQEPDGGIASSRETAKGPVNGVVAKQSASGTKTDTPIIETPQGISVVGAQQLSFEELKAICDEAARHGVKVAAQGVCA